MIGQSEIVLTLPIAIEELEVLARRRGYASIEAYILALIDQDDEVQWDEQFATSQDKLERMAEAALAEHTAGNTEEFDPDNDVDMP